MYVKPTGQTAGMRRQVTPMLPVEGRTADQPTGQLRMLGVLPWQNLSGVIIQARLGQPTEETGDRVRGRKGRRVGLNVVGLAVAPTRSGEPVGASVGAGDGSGVTGFVGTQTTPIVVEAAMRRYHVTGQVLRPFCAAHARTGPFRPPRQGIHLGGQRMVGDWVGVPISSSLVGRMLGRRVGRPRGLRTGAGVSSMISSAWGGLVTARTGRRVGQRVGDSVGGWDRAMLGSAEPSCQS